MPSAISEAWRQIEPRRHQGHEELFLDVKEVTSRTSFLRGEKQQHPMMRLSLIGIKNYSQPWGKQLTFRRLLHQRLRARLYDTPHEQRYIQFRRYPDQAIAISYPYRNNSA